jgi:hypothetical protein
MQKNYTGSPKMGTKIFNLHSYDMNTSLKKTNNYFKLIVTIFLNIEESHTFEVVYRKKGKSCVSFNKSLL